MAAARTAQDSGRDYAGLKDDAPLAVLRSRAEALRDGHLFGERLDAVLIPETVAFATLRVGRFEITRAQYAEFDSGFKLKPGEENLPATGMGYVKAYKYVLWLAARTGRAYRLPSDEEAFQFSKLAKPGGNTLNHWLGRFPKPDEADRVRQTVAATLGPTALLLTVGSLAGTRDGEQTVFDLNGNAAEWARNAQGDGVLIGRSADQPLSLIHI